MSKSPIIRKSVIKKVAATVSRGVPLKHAAMVAGITDAQLRRWMKKGAEMRAILYDTGSFPVESSTEDWLSAELHQEVEVAHAKVVERMSRKINAAAAKSWQAAAWWLQRREREHYGMGAEIKDDSKPQQEEREQFVFHCPENGRG